MARYIITGEHDDNNLNKHNSNYEQLFDEANKLIPSSKIYNGAVTNDKLATRSVTWDKLAEDAVTNSRLAENAVDNRALSKDAVLPENIVQNGVTNRELAGNSVSTIKIIDKAVTNAKLDDNAVQPHNIVNNGVRENNLAGNSVSTTKIIDRAVTSDKMSDSTVTERTLNTGINDRTYNANYKIGGDLGTSFFDVNTGFIDVNIKALRVFLRSGETQLSLSDMIFKMERNTTLYIDMAESSPTVKLANNPPQSGVEFGNGGFFEDKKIFLLSNFYGVITGLLAESFNLAVQRTKNEKLLAQKTDAETHHIFIQSKRNARKYARYEIRRAVANYDENDKRSNVDVHEINGVKMMSRESDDTFKDLGDIATGGAWSCAIRESSSTDAVGGIAHGDEVESYCNILMDGIKSAMPYDLRVYEEVELVAASTLYKDSGKYPDLQTMGKHFKSFKFNKNDGMVIDSKVIMESDLELIFVYLGMASVLKDYTNKAISDVDIDINDLTVDAPIHLKRQGIDRIDVYGDDVYFRTNVLERQTPSTHNAKVEKISYNKIYYDLIEDYFNSTSGSVYRQKTQYEIGIL